MMGGDRRDMTARVNAAPWWGVRLALAGAALALLTALGCGGGKSTSGDASAGASDRSAAHADSGGNPGGEKDADPTSPEAEDRYHDYAVVTERDIFHPLAREAASLRNPERFPNPQSRGKAADNEEPPKGPTDDVAVTGFIEMGGQLQALVENVETGEGRYVAAGETIFGLTVAAIKRGRVVFGKDGKTYEVAAGEKEIKEEQVATEAKEEKKEEQEEKTPQGPSGDMDIMRHIPPGMSAAQLRVMYERYKQYLSPEQRAQAEEYIRKKEESEGG